MLFVKYIALLLPIYVFIAMLFLLILGGTDHDSEDRNGTEIRDRF